MAETLAAGALVLVERGNAEVPLLLQDGVEYASYDETDLEADEVLAMVRKHFGATNGAS